MFTADQKEEYLRTKFEEFKAQVMGDLELDPKGRHPQVQDAVGHIDRACVLFITVTRLQHKEPTHANRKEDAGE